MWRSVKQLCIAVLFIVGVHAQARDVAFTLQSPEGVVTEKSYEGKYLLMAIGFTSCPDICPTTLYEFANTLKAVKNPEAVQALFVTIDPVNDDVARLNAYTQHFDPRIVGLGGEMADIRAFTDLLGASFGYRLNGKRIEQPEAGTPYTVYHSSLVYLISPERKLVEVFDYQIGAKGMVEALDKVLGEAPAAQPSTAENCPLPEGFAKADTGLNLKDILPDAPDNKVALFNIWALWCKPCRAELPLLDEYAGKQNDMAVHVVNLGDEDAQIDEIFQELKLAHLAKTRSDDSDLLEKVGAVGLPFTALFVDGKQVANKAGIIHETESFTAYAQCLSKPTSQP